jgi:hypothetical protein
MPRENVSRRSCKQESNNGGNALVFKTKKMKIKKGHPSRIVVLYKSAKGEQKWFFIAVHAQLPNHRESCQRLLERRECPQRVALVGRMMAC